MAIQLKCKNLILGYDGNCIIQDLNFMVSNGDYLCILGENGSGKSTLMKALLGLNAPISGEINFCGDTSKNQVGYLPQQTLVQKDFPASVQEIVQSGCISRCGLRAFYNKQEKQLASDMMEKLEIKNLAKSCYRELSGGQQQRVLLARALCSARKMLLL
ncbi:MAG: ATP-binding cassette domain-containing protein, partial [Oscillospiraceae bacterium]|nr:ATP-binding cassette domain-containing protein [Oscillospiraceae bacterium]